jgi:hypothetical protein
MSGKSRFSKDQLSQILQEYEAGTRSGLISQKWGIDKKSVTEIVRRLGGTVRRKLEDTGRNKSPMTESEKGAVKRMRDEGMSQQKIGSALGRSQSFVGRALDEMGYARAEIRTGSRHGSWRGGISINQGGYIMQYVARDDPMASMRNSIGYVAQHRLVMARHLDRPLARTETVHHINGDRKDNSIENLQIRVGSHGAGIAMVCACCGSSNLVPAKITDGAD